MSHSHTISSHVTLKSLCGAIIHSAKAAGDFLYGDDARTHRTLCFAYGCIGFYVLLSINAPLIPACAL